MTSPKGALGVGQIMPTTAMDPGYGVQNIFDLAASRGINVQNRDRATAEQLLRDENLNREFGRNYYNAMNQRFGEQGGVAAYNAGPGRVGRNIQQNQGQLNVGQLPQETQGYLQKVGMQPTQQTTQTTQTTTQQPQPEVTMPDSSLYIQRYQGVQDDPRALLQLANDKNAPKYLQNRAISRSAELLTAQKEEQKFKENLPNMSENDLAKMLRSKTSGGNWGTYFLAGLLGMESVRDQEAAKLGIGTERTVMLPNGQAGMIKVARNGTPIEGYFADGRKMSSKDLIEASSQGTGTGLDIVGGTYVNDTTGELGRVVTNKA